jgi:hypothetical protein
MRRAPTWLIPWLVPLVMLLVVLAATIVFWLAIVVLGAVCVAFIFPSLRLRYLRERGPSELSRGNNFLSRRPPDPELRHKNFWDMS